MKNSDPEVLKLGSHRIQRGERRIVQLDVASLYDYTSLSIPIEVVRGKLPGPTMFISAAIHGDEINGVEIIKRLLKSPLINKISGTLILVPVVNVFGFNNKSRYLPDRRDLNRSFPGSPSGSLASRLAHTFMKEVVSKCSYGIDLHTGAIHRSNLPQIRACLDQPNTKKLALAFGARVVIHSELRDGSLREAARRRKVSMLLYEGGQALRFEDGAIRTGTRGCFAVMREIGMLPKRKALPEWQQGQPMVAIDSYWVRAPHSGSFRQQRKMGDVVEEGDTLAVITDLFGNNPYEVTASESGVIIGVSQIPLVNKGDAMFHLATFDYIRNRRLSSIKNLADLSMDGE